MSMKTILENVIRNNGLPLAQVNERIETMYLTGRISGEERAELIGLMHEKANPANEAGDYRALYEALVVKYNELEARVKALEDADGADEGGAADGYPEWKPWDGVSAGYKYGDIVRHNGKVWENMLEGMANVWEPGAAGVDERYWMEIDGENAAGVNGE